jgi:hypothetical protein
LKIEALLSCSEIKIKTTLSFQSKSILKANLLNIIYWMFFYYYILSMEAATLVFYLKAFMGCFVLIPFGVIGFMAYKLITSRHGNRVTAGKAESQKIQKKSK